MSNNPEKKEKKIKPEKTRESISSQEESSSSEKAQAEQAETTKMFCKNTINKVKNIKMGALFSEVENLFDSVKKLDAKITMNANGLLSKGTNYFRNSIDFYKKTRK